MSDAKKFVEKNTGSDTSTIMSKMDEAKVPSEQDWDKGETTWTFSDGSKVIVCGSEVRVEE